GSITVHAGTAATSGVSAGGTGNVLLETRADDGDVIINADVTSGSGNISLVSGDDVLQNADVTTAGGSVYVSAANGTVDGPGSDGIVMAAGTTTASGGGNILLTAGNESDIVLGLVNAGAGDVSLSAERSILDSGVALNVQAAVLRMVADSNSDGAGQIGASDTGNGNPAANANAIAT